MIRDSRFMRELTARRAGYRASQYRIAHEWADLPLYAEPMIHFVQWTAPIFDIDYALPADSTLQ